MQGILSRAGSIGDIKIIIARPGRSDERHLVKNLWTDGGLAYLAGLAAGEDIATIGWMAIGTGTVPETGTSVTLGAEVARVPVTKSGIGASRALTAVFGDGVGLGAITESGLFNAAAAGLMTNRSVFGVKTKAAGEVFTFVWTLTQVRAA